METKINVGITGQTGFMGAHLYNYLSLKSDVVNLISFQDNYFEDEALLNTFTSRCDVIVHLAAMNRHGDPQVIYDTNIRLVQQLIKSLNTTESSPLVIFSSSTQENLDNAYGTSKKECRKLLENWASKSEGKCCSYVIPNVFGPFGNPFYNSVVATFSYQLIHDEKPIIKTDSNLKLIYIQELIEHFYHEIISITAPQIETFVVPHTMEIKVSEILEKLRAFKATYFEQHNIPALETNFDRNLFNTFRSYINPENFFPVKYHKHEDTRGAFIEIIRFQQGGQVSFSTTLPGNTRGNHFHTRKIERFSVIRGEALIQLRQIGTDKIIPFRLSGTQPAFVDMPVWYTHNLINVGNDELYTLFWINENFDPADPDTYFEEVTLTTKQPTT